jgi:hypothetical protein
MAPSVALSLLAPDCRTNLITIRCMRKTLHALPLSLAAAAHGATVHFRVRDTLRAITNASLGPGSIARVAASIARLLSEEGPLFHREIEARMAGKRTTTAATRLALKLSWEQGELTYINDTRGWNRENRKFGLTSSIYPNLNMSMGRSQATGELVRAYFDRYGPASLRDAMWWSGLSRSAIATAMNESGRNFVAIYSSWCDSVMYMYQDRFDEFQSVQRTQRSSGVNFLAHEDVALKAYFESRRRYLGELLPRQVFNRIGEALPTVVRDGLVVGTWAWDPVHRVVKVSLEDCFSSAEFRREVVLNAHKLTDALRLGWIPTPCVRPRSGSR